AHSSNARDRMIDLFIGVDILQFLSSVHFQRRESFRHDVACSVADVSGAIAADPRVHFDFVATFSTQQLVYRRIVKFSFDVPQCLINPGDGAHENGPSAIEATAIHYVPMVFDAHGVLSDQVFHQLFYGSAHRRSTSFDYRFAPAVNTFVRFNLQEKPPRWHEKQFVVGYLHGRSVQLDEPLTACTKARAVSRIVSRYSSVIGVRAFTSADPIPKATPPASMYALILSGRMPPVGINGILDSGARTSRM